MTTTAEEYFSKHFNTDSNGDAKANEENIREYARLYHAEKLREAEGMDLPTDQDIKENFGFGGYDDKHLEDSESRIMEGAKWMRSKLSPKIAQLQAEKERMREALQQTDDMLAHMEDYTHGTDGDRITTTRGIIGKALASLPEEKGELTYKDFPNSVYDLPYNKKVELWMNQENDIVIGEKVHHNERGDVIFLTPERNPEYSYPLSWFDGWREIK